MGPEDRYQYQSLARKAWRCRWYIPYLFYFGVAVAARPLGYLADIPLRGVWGIMVGSAQLRMGYWYTREEVEALERERGA